MSASAGAAASQQVAGQDNVQFEIELRDGTVVTRQFQKPSLTWTDVSKQGEMSKQQIELSRIKSVKFSLEPASEQLARVLKLLAQLDSDDFHLRENAETELADAGVRFRNVLEQNRDLKTLDGTFRLKRVLKSMKSSKKDSAFTLDVLTLQDGTELSGDAGNGSYKIISSDGQVEEIPRSRIAAIIRAKPLAKTRPEQAASVETTLFHNHAKFMQNRELIMVDFDFEPDGAALDSNDKDVNDTFVDWGLTLGTEVDRATVGISGYEIESGDRPVGGNSICVQPEAQSKRFRGVMEISFCQPGTGSVPHGVYEVGMFVSRVNHSRDILVEAWDSMGRLIGVCESSDEPCTFCGISSSVPIAKVRVLSNPWMLELRKLNAEVGKRALQKVDTDYAVDSILFSTPVPIDSPRTDVHYFGKNGDMVTTNSLKVVKDREFLVKPAKLPSMTTTLSKTNTIVFTPIPKPFASRKYEGRWFAMLKDNSVLQWSPEKLLFSETLGSEIDPADVLAIWPANQALRLPLADDFKSGDNVLVYPGCRVGTPKVKINANGFAWDSQNVLTQKLYEEDEFKVDRRSNDESDAVEPRAKIYAWDISELPAYEIPSIWFSKPSLMLAGQGAVKLKSGEILVYGNGATFKLLSVGPQEVKLSVGDRELSLPMSSVNAIVATQE